MFEAFITSIGVCFVILFSSIWASNTYKSKGLLAALVFFFSLLTISGYEGTSHHVIQSREKELLISLFIMYSVPLCIAALFVKLTQNIKSKTRNIMASIASIVAGAVWPFFALVTVCTVGLDCI
ncbi:hypothetical protein Q4561_19650 [Alteromonas sp. 1_MG-2023]|uniref:hypothetical protein n=1 Tax=Alteromonas sp. 1_MG-2023 TaxID=3062669 RepID=UPI0026E28B67|nr:hypothetical protein [Alteromonas sp. 1_MG-2023]MDO6569286.1 hypothetical protein [Alteromonas sp. 1_MG-2023]